MKSFVAIVVAGAFFSSPALAQSSSQEPVQNVAVPGPAPVGAAPTSAPVAVTATPVSASASGHTLPAATLLVVTPLQEISSKHIEQGERFKFQVVNDVVQDGFVVIPRGSPVTGIITFKTGRAIGGKSGKFEVTFDSVTVGGRSIKLTGKHRQEGRGNTVGALLGSLVISGRSAVMDEGQLVNCFTAEPVAF